MSPAARLLQTFPAIDISGDESRAGVFAQAMFLSAKLDRLVVGLVL
jgi:hypothetical protein